MNLLLVVTGVFLLTISTISAIPPVYFFTTGVYGTNETYPVTFNTLNIDTNTSQKIYNTTIGAPVTPYLTGMVIYYKTGVLYAAYSKLLTNTNSETYQSYLLAYDTNTNQLIFNDYEFCDGDVIAGLAIDQTTGDIHFFNDSSTTNNNPFEMVTSDWTVWNAETMMINIVKRNISTLYSSEIVYNSLTSTLWQMGFGERKLISYTVEDEPTIYHTLNYFTGLTINIKTGDMYTRGYYAVYQLNINPSKTFVTASLICDFAPLYSVMTMADAADYDYTTNTWVISLNQIHPNPGPDYFNAMMYANLDSCDQQFYFYSSPQNQIRMGITRFNSGQSLY